jgi:hypothetical protein
MLHLKIKMLATYSKWRLLINLEETLINHNFMHQKMNGRLQLDNAFCCAVGNPCPPSYYLRTSGEDQRKRTKILPVVFTDVKPGLSMRKEQIQLQLQSNRTLF